MERAISNANTVFHHYAGAQAHEAAAAAARCEQLKSRQRRTAPDFSLNAAQGGVIRLSTLRDRPVVLTFFTPPGWVSRAQIRALNEVAQYGLAVVLGIAAEDCSVLRGFALEKQVRFPLLRDPEARVMGRYNAPSLPATYCIDGEGKIAAAQGGLVSASTLLEWLARL